MIDWLTLRLPLMRPDGELILPIEVIEKLRGLHSRIQKINPDGTLEWETCAWESVKSDSHQLAVKVTDCFHIQGSPARAMYENNVFGSDDILECFKAMVKHVSKALDVFLPVNPALWVCSRIDVTYNYDLGSQDLVKQALLTLKQSEGGHYQTATSHETIYWNKGSQLRSGKAYGKGAQLAKLVKKFSAIATPEQVEACDRLLRLELMLRSKFLRERCDLPWHKLTPELLEQMHTDYFRPLIGNLRVKDMNEKSLYDLVLKGAPTKRQGASAWRTYQAIKQSGFRACQETMSHNTFYRHKRILLAAGLSLAQMQGSTVVPLVRHKSIALGNPVTSWSQLMTA